MRLSASVGREVTRTAALVAALEERRSFFRAMGAVAADHGVQSAYTASLDEVEADAILDHALRGEVTLEEARRFTGHMLIEFARMSVEDGLVMQLHVGSFRNHNRTLFERFGADMGADIPVAAEFTRNLAAAPRAVRERSAPDAHRVHARRKRVRARASPRSRATTLRSGSARHGGSTTA